MEKLVKHLEFSEKIYSIQNILTDFTLPVVLKATTQCLLSGKTSVQQGDILTVHGKKTVGVLNGKDDKGNTINLVTCCPYQVQLALPEEERVSFKSLKELCEKEGRPKFVEAKMDKENELESVKNGDRLKVLLVEKGSSGPLLMHFRNEKGKHVKLPVDLKASFVACPPDKKEYFISEIATNNKAPLANFVQFSPCEETNVYSSLGVIEIQEQSSIDLVYMTLKDGGKLHCCVNVSSIDFNCQVPSGFVNKTDDYKQIESAIIELVEVEKFDAIVGSVDPLEWSPNFIVPFDKVFPKKKKAKGKKKDEEARLSVFTGDTDENLSDSAASDSAKKKKRFTLFKDDNSKGEKKENGKKEKKEKNKKKVSEGSSIDLEEKEVEKCENEVRCDEKCEDVKIEVPTEAPVSSDRAPTVVVSKPTEEDLKKKAKEEKKKLKMKKAQEKKEKKDEKKEKEKEKKKKKKEKIETENSSDLLPTNNSADSLSSGPSAPNSPNCDLDDDYEMPVYFGRREQDHGEGHEKEKPKSKTLISRTWKKMKKRRRAMLDAQMQRSYSDASDVKHKTNKADGNDITPPLIEPDYDEDLYEQIPGEFMSQDIYEEAIRAYGAYECPVSPKLGKVLSSPSETGDSGFDESDQKAIENLRETAVPPPLPGNHPKMHPPERRRGSSVKSDNLSRASVDSAGFRKFYESLKASEAELRSWGPEEIEKVLKDLQLDQYTDKFAESQVDGSLLIDLDEAVLRDLGLNIFEARKLRKFVFGWRPDASRRRDYYDKYEKSSKNPSHWNTTTVASVLRNELGMNELAKYCSENQINGDLLRDIVVDEELMKFLLAGKDMRLNAVKLKNFVLDGWRPQKKKSNVSSPYEEPVSASTSQPAKFCSETYEEPVPSATAKSLGKSRSYEEPMPASPNSHVPYFANVEEISQTYEEPVSPSVTTSYEEPVSPKTSSASPKAAGSNSEPATPVRLADNKKQPRKTSVEKVNLLGSAGGVNSLMQKYEQKSNTIGASPRWGKKSEPTSQNVHQGISHRTASDAPFVANMKKKFSEQR